LKVAFQPVIIPHLFWHYGSRKRHIFQILSPLFLNPSIALSIQGQNVLIIFGVQMAAVQLRQEKKNPDNS
jgi:hypothetical protein